MMLDRARRFLALDTKDKIVVSYVIFCRIRTLVFYSFFYSIGKKSFIEPPLRLITKGSVVIGQRSFIKKCSWMLSVQKSSVILIGDRVQVGNYIHIVSLNKVIIEDDVLIADRVFISDCSHEYDSVDTPFMYQDLKLLTGGSSLSIGEGSWIGEGVSVLGANIGKMSIIGANSVVTSDIPDYSVAVGAPAKVVKRYCFEKNEWERVN